MNPAKPIEDLILQGSPNLRRGIERSEREKKPLTLDQENTIAEIDELIAASINAAKRGQTVDGKKNPAFENLHVLLKAKALVVNDKGAKKSKSVAKLLAEADAFLGKEN